jgi:hypothetical protein
LAIGRRELPDAMTEVELVAEIRRDVFLTGHVDH